MTTSQNAVLAHPISEARSAQDFEQTDIKIPKLAKSEKIGGTIVVLALAVQS